MAAHSSILAWRIPWIEKPGSLQSMGSHNLVTKPPQVTGSTCEAPQPHGGGVRPEGSWRLNNEDWFQEGVLWTSHL